MTILDLLLISFSTYFTYSVLSEYPLPGILKRSFLTIFIISGVNVILVSSFKDLYIVQFSLGVAGIAYFLHIIKLKRIFLINERDGLERQETTLEKLKQNQGQALMTVNNTVSSSSEQRTPASIPQTAAIISQTAARTPPASKNQYPIVTKITTMASPITLNEFYKEASNNKMLLSDVLVKRLTNKNNNRL